MPVKRLYKKWMHDWETRMTTRDTNRIVRPLDWGLEWMREWPKEVLGEETPDVFLSRPPTGVLDLPNVKEADSVAQEKFLQRVNQRILADSDIFFRYTPPTDFKEH